MDEFSRKHGDNGNVNAPGLILPTHSDLIQTSYCCSDGLVVRIKEQLNDIVKGCSINSTTYASTIVIQTGAHDLANMPVRYLIQNPKQLPDVLDQIESILETVLVAFNSSESSSCPPNSSGVPFARIIIVATPPYELPRSPLKYKNYHTNSNIKAINAFLKYNVGRIQNKYIAKFPLLKEKVKVLLKYFDAFEIISPMLFHLPQVFEREGGHYIVHPDHSNFTLSTPPGKIAVAELLHLICDDILKYNASYDDSGSNLVVESGLYFSRSLVLPPGRGGDLINGTYFFIVEYGIKRLVPDLPTYEYLGLDPQNFLELDSNIANDIPTDRPLLSRKDGTLYQSHVEFYDPRTDSTTGTDICYRMKNGMRVEVKNVPTGSDANLEYDYCIMNSIVAPEYELFSIPIFKTGTEFSSHHEPYDEVKWMQ